MFKKVKKIFCSCSSSESTYQEATNIMVNEEEKHLKILKDLYKSKEYENIHDYWLKELRQRKNYKSEHLTIVISALSRLNKPAFVSECCNLLIKMPSSSTFEMARNKSFVARILMELNSAPSTLMTAQEYSKEAIEALEQFPKECMGVALAGLLMECHQIRGNLYRKRGYFDRALQSYRKAQKVFERHWDKIDDMKNSLLQMDIAVCHLLREDEEIASRYLGKIHKVFTSSELYESEGMKILQDKYYYYIAWMYLISGHIDEARTALGQVSSDGDVKDSEVKSLSMKWLELELEQQNLSPYWKEEQYAHLRSKHVCVWRGPSNPISIPIQPDVITVMEVGTQTGMR